MEFRMTKSRKLNPVVLAVEAATSELNDLLNAIGLRISLLQHQVEAAAFEAEIARLAGLVDKATQRVRLLDEYARAEALVAAMRPEPPKRMTKVSSVENLDAASDRKAQTALLITDAAEENSAIKDCLERNGCTVVVAKSSAAGLQLLQSNQNFDHILCDSAFIAETGSKFTAELSRAAPESRVYVLKRHLQFAAD
jgi:PleD family two-component response regulator